MTPISAQDARVLSQVKGVVTSDQGLVVSQLMVNLLEAVSRKTLDRAFVRADGAFEFRDVRIGAYTFQLIKPNGDSISEETVNLNASGDRVEIRIPTQAETRGPGGTVSVRQLQHPLSAKSKRMLAEAQKASAAGQHEKAIEILRGALEDPGAVAYARVNIGAALLRTGRAAAAVPELQEAVRLLPQDAVAHTNLAYALLMTRRAVAAEAEARQALRIDRNSAKARWVLGSILLAEGQVVEAEENLRFASREIPKARMVLAQVYERNGQKDAAVRELREFLPQASNEDRATVEKWLTKLAVK